MVKQVVKDIYGTTETGGTPYFIQSPALLRLQEAAEEFLENILEQIKDITRRSGRRHVLPRDVQEWKRITGFRVNRPCYQSLCSIFSLLPRKSVVPDIV